MSALQSSFCVFYAIIDGDRSTLITSAKTTNTFESKRAGKSTSLDLPLRPSSLMLLQLLLIGAIAWAEQESAFGRQQGKLSLLEDVRTSGSMVPKLKCKGRRRRRRGAARFPSACKRLSQFGTFKGGSLLVQRITSGKRVVIASLGDGADALIQVLAKGVNHGILPNFHEAVRISDFMFRAFHLQAPGSFPKVRGSCIREGLAPMLAFDYLKLGVLGSAVVPAHYHEPPAWRTELLRLPERQQSASRVSMLRDLAKAFAVLHNEVPNLLGTSFTLCDFRANQIAVDWAPAPCFGASVALTGERCMHAKLIDLDNARAVSKSRFSSCNWDDHPPAYGFPPEFVEPKLGSMRADAAQLLDSFQFMYLVDIVLSAVDKAASGGRKYARAEAELQQRLRAGLRHATPSKRWTTLRAWQEIDSTAVSLFGATSEFPWHQDLESLRSTLLKPHWPQCELSCDQKVAVPEPCSSTIRFQ